MRDSGNFNYHLDRLVGRFVLETEDGYRIAPAGIEIVAALIAGSYGAGEPLGPVTLDDDCPVCEESLKATYENHLFEVACENDHRFRNTLPPGAVDNRSLTELIELLTLTTKQHLELAVNGICPFCQGQLEWSIQPDTDRELPEFGNQCSRCGVVLEVPAVAPLLAHPAVIAFFYDHGIDLRDRPLWAPEFYEAVTLDISRDPLSIDISIELDGDALGATLNEELTVVEIDV